ncbi:spore protease YyaC [Clostridium sp. PL3]|uniref:Spore protease YyaC n=1 Tax=Clostridium thailandense TaxID=2794346 RepID=A0A949U0Y7_9CLOT|nr:spore protease YyaC [Clostridium thailandense]MBV7275350.1 spore protease YyaC [Clostridium thailandense]
MGFFNNILRSKVFKKEHISYAEKKSTTKNFIIYKDETLYKGVEFFRELIKSNLDNIVVICIGTDKWIFDSLAPFVGSILESRGFSFPVYGTIEHPIHAINLEDFLIKIKNNHPNGFFIGIDACYSDKSSLFQIHLRDYPIHPGTGTNKILPSVGDISIVGIIAINDNDAYLHEIRLKDVLFMANKIADILIESVESCTSSDLFQNTEL